MIFFLTSLLVYAGIGLSENGKLPRGKSGSTPGSKLVLPKKKPKDGCSQYLAALPQADGFFSGGKFYYLARKGGAASSGGHRFYLLDIDLAKNQSSRLVSLKLRYEGAVIPHGEPLESISILSFIDGDPFCLMGKANVISLSFKGISKVRRIIPTGNYRIVESDKGPILADLQNASFKMVDPSTFQSRKVGKFPPEKVPLYFDQGNNSVLTFSKSNPTIVDRYRPGDLKPVARFKLKENLKIVHHAGQVGFLGSDPATGKILLGQIRKWSGDRNIKFELDLPSGFEVSESQVKVSYQHGYVFVFGVSAITAKKWRRLFVFNFNKKQLIKTLSAPKDHYISGAILSPDEKVALFPIKRLEDDALLGMSKFELESGSWHRIHFSNR